MGGLELVSRERWSRVGRCGNKIETEVGIDKGGRGCLDH